MLLVNRFKLLVSDSDLFLTGDVLKVRTLMFWILILPAKNFVATRMLVTFSTFPKH